MYDIVGKRRWYYLFSALITIPGLIFIALGGLKPSIDFTGGTVWQVRFLDDPTAAEVQAALVELGHPEAIVEEVDGGYLEVRTGACRVPDRRRHAGTVADAGRLPIGTVRRLPRRRVPPPRRAAAGWVADSHAQPHGHAIADPDRKPPRRRPARHHHRPPRPRARPSRSWSTTSRPSSASRRPDRSTRSGRSSAASSSGPRSSSSPSASCSSCSTCGTDSGSGSGPPRSSPCSMT